MNSEAKSLSIGFIIFGEYDVKKIDVLSDVGLSHKIYVTCDVESQADQGDLRNYGWLQHPARDDVWYFTIKKQINQFHN